MRSSSPTLRRSNSCSLKNGLRKLPGTNAWFFRNGPFATRVSITCDCIRPDCLCGPRRCVVGRMDRHPCCSRQRIPCHQSARQADQLSSPDVRSMEKWRRPMYFKSYCFATSRRCDPRTSDRESWRFRHEVYVLRGEVPNARQELACDSRRWSNSPHQS